MIFTVINRIRSLNNRKGKSDYAAALSDNIKWLDNFFNEINTDVDKDLFAAMLQLYIENQPPAYVSPYTKTRLEKYKDYKTWSNELYDRSVFINKEKVLQLLSTDPEQIFDALQTDEAAKLVTAIADFYENNVAINLNSIQSKINGLQRRYMQAQMDVFKNKVFYPDANSTLRVAFGNVNGYTAPSGKKYEYYTYLDGVIEKYKPGDYEFDVPEKLRELYKNKDYGRYGINGKMPVCFIASNHTTGGNSGSPVLDAYGNLAGINFDRVWEGTMSDVNYDPSICRNIMVDIRYVLFIIDKYAGAGHLVDEMKLVYAPK